MQNAYPLLIFFLFIVIWFCISWFYFILFYFACCIPFKLWYIRVMKMLIFISFLSFIFRFHNLLWKKFHLKFNIKMNWFIWFNISFHSNKVLFRSINFLTFHNFFEIQTNESFPSICIFFLKIMVSCKVNLASNWLWICDWILSR